jgi:hypothetical protein
MCLSLAVTEIQPLPVSANFCDFSSKIIKNRPFSFWSDGSITCSGRDTTTSDLGRFWRFFRQKSSKIGILQSVRHVYHLPLSRYDPFRSWVIFRIFRQKLSKGGHFSFGPTCLSLVVDEIRPLPLWGICRNFYRK